MKTYTVTVEFEVEIADAYKRENVWKREQAYLDEYLPRLEAKVVNVVEKEDVAPSGFLRH